MGCASSTPMVATAGSEILKAATHVADDAKNKAKGAVEEVSNTLGKTLETAKDTVGNAVTGLTNELGNAFKEQTETLEESKDKVNEKLHMSDVAAEVVAKELDARLDNLSRATTPNANADADSLKTSTPEPEIEQALANHVEDEENPPTPKPTLAELAHLSAEAATIAAVTAATVEQHPAVAAAPTAAAAKPAPETVTNVATAVDKKATTTTTTTTTTNEGELKRPSTTEWEKFADMLAHNRKFKPYEAFAHNVNQFSVYQDYTRLKDIPGPHYDGSFSDATSSNTLTSLSQSSLSSPHFHHTPATVLVPPATIIVPPIVTTSAMTATAAVASSKKVYPRDFASLVACEQPGSVSRLSNRSTTSLGRQFDYNPSRERVTLPIVSSSTTHLGSMVTAAAATAMPIVLGKGSSWARQPSDGSVGGQQTPQPLPLKLGTLSRASQSSSNSSGGVVIRSNFTTPSTMSPTLTLPSLGKCAEEEEPLVEDRVMGAGIAIDVVPGDLVPLNLVPSSGTVTPTPSLLRRSRTPTRRPSNTSSFLSSPRVSPFSVRKDYGDKENKATFIAELSSVTPKRNGSKVPLSPYRIRERCDVCYNKYVIK